MLNSLRQFFREAAIPSHRGCGARLGCASSQPRHEVPIVAPLAGAIAPQQIDESHRHLRKADERFKMALIQLNIARKLLTETRGRSADDRVVLQEEIQASLMQNFCALLVEKEDRRVRRVEKTLYLGSLSREEMAQRRQLRQQQQEHLLESEDVMFAPTSEIAMAQQMADDASHKEYAEAYTAHCEAYRIMVVMEKIIQKVKRDLTENQQQDRDRMIAPGGITVPNPLLSLDKVDQLTKVISDLSNLDQLSRWTHCAKHAHKINVEFAKNLLQRARQSDNRYEIQAWNAVLDQLAQKNKWEKQRDKLERRRSGIERTMPRMYALATQILAQFKEAYARGDQQKVEQCISDISYQVVHHTSLEGQDMEEEQKFYPPAASKDPISEVVLMEI